MWLKPLKIGARQSDLAKLQAYLVGDALKAQGHQVEYLFRESLGDKNLENPLWKMPEKGVFTEDFFQDLLKGSLDLVVHSWKDLPVEEKKETFIAATLPRADQRDLLLLKKNSLGKKNLQIFSSSPRREKNLQSFLPKVIPQAKTVQFQPVRGNIQTRVRKLLERTEVDGLIVAKAAIDRLLTTSCSEFSSTKIFLCEALDQKLRWMVLPLENNPNAPAQGALAIEIRRDRQNLVEILKTIHCQKTFESVQKERQVFSQFGGGCHQKIGVAILDRPYGEIEILCGESPEGKEFHHRILSGKRPIPAELHRKEIEFEILRKPKNDFRVVNLANVNALFVSRFEAWPENFAFQGVVWAAGIKTWQKLAAHGIWVSGCAEGLGEQENPQIEVLCGKPLTWKKLTHDGMENDSMTIATYHLSLTPKPFQVAENDIFHWKSYSQFAACLKAAPELNQARHSCGPGRSFEMIRQALGSDEKLFVALS